MVDSEMMIFGLLLSLIFLLPLWFMPIWLSYVWAVMIATIFFCMVIN